MNEILTKEIGSDAAFWLGFWEGLPSLILIIALIVGARAVWEKIKEGEDAGTT